MIALPSPRRLTALTAVSTAAIGGTTAATIGAGAPDAVTLAAAVAAFGVAAVVGAVRLGAKPAPAA
ncbi:hypothetical protein AB0I66_08640 [Streptomyces sp. NPDC050439]|uniref:hypothetical protein n=1 Tax=unclassified Streptomyces TaxID=2593676 RepID=UPI003424CD8E